MSRTPPAQLFRCPLRALQVFVLLAACSLAGRAQSTMAAGGPPESAGAANAAADQDAGNSDAASPAPAPPAAMPGPAAEPQGVAAEPAGPHAAPAPAEAGPASPASQASPASPPTNDALLAAQVEPGKSDPVDTRLIDVATPFTVGRRRLELLFTHRFVQPINQGANAHNLWGLDSGADVGIGFTYGLLRHLDLSVYRSSFQEDFELAGKLQIL